jgi:cytochrome b pre-mRNA-processing protein 3
MRFPRIFRPRDFSDEAHGLYVQIVQQARRPAFFRAGGVPDTLDGRFDLILLHVFLVLERLRGEGPAAQETGQELFDVMFADLDQSLREMGVGDMGIGKRIKKMGQAFYGRIEAYSAALQGGEAELEEALRRNLYGTIEPDSAQVALLAGYVRAQMATLEGEETEGLLRGEIHFAAPAF